MSLITRTINALAGLKGRAKALEQDGGRSFLPRGTEIEALVEVPKLQARPENPRIGTQWYNVDSARCNAA